MSKKQIEVKIEVVSNKPIFSYHLLEASKVIQKDIELGNFCSFVRIRILQDFKFKGVRVTSSGLFIDLEYDDEDYLSRRVMQRFNKLEYIVESNIFNLVDDEYIKITESSQWFKTINSSGMVSEYYVVEYENKKYLFLDHLCGNREIFDIENDKVYKDFLNRKIPCDFKTDIYKKYLKDRDMTNSEWTVKEFKNNKMNYNFTARMY